LRASGLKPVILLDEITSALDSVTESTIHRIIDEEFIKEGHTAIVVTHKFGVLEKYSKGRRDAVVVIANGGLAKVDNDSKLSSSYIALRQMI
jgi:ATP-binding cassette, subfamily C (CFTR/MRP), member 1